MDIPSVIIFSWTLPVIIFFFLATALVRVTLSLSLPKKKVQKLYKTVKKVLPKAAKSLRVVLT